MIVDTLFRIFATRDASQDESAAWPAGLPLSGFLQDLEDLRILGSEALGDLLAADVAISPEEATILARQIETETVDETDPSGCGRLVIGSNPDERTTSIHFRHGVSTGLATVHLPFVAPAQENESQQPFERTVRLLLVNLRSPDYPLITSPLGIITLGGYARQRFGDDVDIQYLDLQLDSDETLLNEMDAFKPDMIGLSVMTGAHDEMHRVLNKIQRFGGQDGPMVVLGNVVPTYAFEGIHHRHRDPICVVGRGEPAIDAIVRHIGHQRERKDLFQIPNSSFVSGSIIYQIGGSHFSTLR